MSELPSPYDEPELYDFLFESLEFDLPFLLATAHAGGGPVLEVGCGTGRVLLRLRAAGLDAEGLEPSATMIARLHDKARERGLEVRVTRGDVRTFELPRRFARVLMPFNAFSHLLTLDDQLAALRRMYAHVAPGGALVVHLSQPTPAMWAEAAQDRVLEHEAPAPTAGHVLRIYDTRRKDACAQTQHSIVDIEECDVAGAIVRSARTETRHRWVHRNELELLLRHAGCDRVELRGDGGEGPVTSASREMWALGARADRA